MKKVFLLKGEGIECEKESMRFLQKSHHFTQIIDLVIPKLKMGSKNPLIEAEPGDWLFIPGGFAFADHFGAGRLLAHRLDEMGIFQEAKKRGLNFLGICNGFQMMVAAGFFGEQVRLLENSTQGRRLGFVNRWVHLKAASFLFPSVNINNPEQELSVSKPEFFLPVRHGEGRLFLERDIDFSKEVRPFLHYVDSNFENGSREHIAGLHAQWGQSHFWGMMPHPEIAMTALSGPNVCGAEYFERFRGRTREYTGDGFRLLSAIVAYSAASEHNHNQKEQLNNA